MTTIEIGLIVAAYLMGSLSFAVIVSKAFGLDDPRSYGSKNPGATNVLRSGKKLAAALTLLGDALKGWLPVFFVLRYAPQLQVDHAAIAGVALAVIVGHMWPIFFGFKGGKGVATAAGVLIALNPTLGLAVAGIWLTLAVVLKISSLAALCAAIAAPFLTIWLLPERMFVGAVVVISLLLIERHKQNILDLFAGKEGKIGEKL